MTLTAYLQLHSISQTEFARRIGVSPRAVNTYVNGTRRPSWPVVARIAKATENAVTANDWVDGQRAA